MKNANNYFLGLDIGTDSVGYAATSESYEPIKHKGEPMLGVHLFEEVQSNNERRIHRIARRRLQRRQTRVKLVQEIFAQEIAKKDEHFYRRIKESALWREDAHDAYSLFADEGFTDKEYYEKYPTIHHLIFELVKSSEPHDVRLVYLACAWLVAHRGHFLSDVSKDHLSEILDISSVYYDLINVFPNSAPWSCSPEKFGDVLKKRLSVSSKYKELCMLIFNSARAPKNELLDEEDYYSTEHILKLLCGGKVSAKDVFGKDEYSELPSFALNKSDDELAEILSELGDDADLILKLKAIFDWAVLADILDGAECISEKKVAVYDQHKADLSLLKRMVRRYANDRYKDVFRDENKPGYATYSKSGDQTDFCKFVKGIFKDVKPQECDSKSFEDLMSKLNNNTLCPKQVVSDNRVIPYQIYWHELNLILSNASKYLTFLNEKDEDGLSAKDKLLSIMEFKIPYFVGPLNRASCFSWVERKADSKIKILPWNFEDIIDLDKSEQAFIDRMTNSCTYLPHADVLPENSLIHQKFQVLNEINSLSVCGQRISSDLKQRIFSDLFLNKKKVTVKAIKNYLAQNGYYSVSDLDTLSGVDEKIKNSLSSYHSFKRLLESNKLTDVDAEEIIRRITYTEDLSRLSEWINKNYSHLSDEDKKYISRLKFKDFARLSKEFLTDLYGTESDSKTGEASSIIDRMWNCNLNLMEVLSERFTYRSQIQAEAENYYKETPKSLDDRMQDLCLPGAVKRSIIRTLDIVSDVVKANRCAPQKIFIEMARGGKPEGKGKRTISRYDHLKALYSKCELEDARELALQLDEMGEERDSRLQGEKLFLYYLQLGRSMYSGEPIDINRLSEKEYDVDHIYPQSKVKDDSVLNNKVLVLSSENGAKGDRYPIAANIRHKMHNWWKLLLDNHFITEEKYKRLTRHTPFDENEEWGFINRQLVETRQSTKAVAALLKEKYPETEIVYVKAGLVSEFRQEFDMLKTRSVNDLHHAKDAFLNIIVGNVYNKQFTRKWFLENRESYNLKVSALFSRTVNIGAQTIWNGKQSLGKIKEIVNSKNSIHLTRYSFHRKGGFFNQNASPKAPDLVPRKANLPAEKYGGYNSKTASAFIFVKYRIGQKSDLMLVVTDHLFASSMYDLDTATHYLKEQVEAIIGREISALELPFGLRQIKMHTIFEFDGLRMAIASKSNKGKTLVFSVTTPLLVGYNYERYIKRLERFVEKNKINPNMIYSKDFDQITSETNLELYKVLMNKLNDTVFKSRPSNPYAVLQNGVDTFKTLPIKKQVELLLQIVSIFGRNTGGCDLEAIGGKSTSAAPTLSSLLSNWTKYYSDVRIVDQSASGLYETRSCNLLNLL